VTRLPYGSWPSPLEPAALAQDSRTLGPVAFLQPGSSPCWQESRPDEGGRNAVACWRDGEVVALLPRDANARSRVHEYGGGSFTPLPDGALVYSEFGDQRLYRAAPGAVPRPVTAEPPEPGAVRYADLEPDPARGVAYAVRERHAAEGVVNDLVAVDLAGAVEPRVVARGHDFFSGPVLSPDGRRLAWLSWDHPRMPWDGTDLWLTDVAPDGSTRPPSHVAGGPAESIFQPAWGPEGVLHFVSDRTGWWNLYRLGRTSIEAVCTLDAEFGTAQWAFGMATYAFLQAGRIGCIVNREGRGHLAIVDPRGSIGLLDLPFTAFPGTLASDGHRLLTVAAGPREVSSVVLVDADHGTFEVLRRAAPLDLDPAFVPEPEPYSFPVEGGEGHALFYAPRHPDMEGPAGERPPLLVTCHGGPTAQVRAAFSPEVTFWTSRGFAVVAVDYGGSTGYGRAYRERLRGQWGVVDVDDCLAAARFLVERGDADPERVAFRGGSAGGFTALCAAAFRGGLAAAVSYFGVADPQALARDTHKFESRYLDGLIGPLPAEAQRYRDRAPLYAADRIRCPVLLLQGTEDRVVPPSQAETMVAALRANGVPVAYVPFEGEDHGFRTAAAITRATAAELAFYGEVFGFAPAGAPLPSLGLWQG
jgi:dipeptidyl aminopeptidase/acylaminoacyl peptidase